MQKVLIVEANDAVRHQAKWVLFQEGLEVIEAADYKEAIQRLNDMMPDLILLDADLPNGTGIKFFQSLQRNKRTQDIPVIFLSSLKTLSPQDSLSMIEGADYVIKPIINQDLLIRVNRHLQLNLTQVLVIDDDTAVRGFIKKLLGVEGFRVHEASTREAAFAYLNQQQPDLILLDTDLGDDSGIALLDTLRQAPQFQDLPVILLTTFNEISETLDISVIESMDFIVKPFRSNDVLLRVKKYCQKALMVKPKIAAEKISNDLQEEDSLAPNDAIQKEKEKLLDHIKVALNHEIRNPLTSILIGSQALNSRFEEGSDEKRVIRGIERCSKRIKDIMDSLGDMKQFVVDEYVDGIKMLNLSKSSGRTTTTDYD